MDQEQRVLVAIGTTREEIWQNIDPAGLESIRSARVTPILR